MSNYEMALSEIEMYKKAHESLSENLTHANKKVQQFKEERDTLIDDLSWYKVKVSRLERENEDLKFTKKMHLGYIKYFSNNNELLRDEVKSLKQENKRLEDENEQLKKENEMIDEQFTDYIDETCGYLKLLFEISQHIGNKPSSSTYKYFRAKLDGLGIEESE